MSHILAIIKGVKFEIIRQVLKADAALHAKQGLYLEHLWKNADDSGEILFLFKAKSLRHARKFIEKVHGQALKENPKANLQNIRN